MPKRKNGGGEYKKVKGSSGSSSPKNKEFLQRAASMIGTQGNLVSTPLQSRSIHDESAPIDFSTLPTKSTFLDQIRDTIRNNPK